MADIVLLELDGDEVSSLSSVDDVSSGTLVMAGRLVLEERSVVVCCAVDVAFVEGLLDVVVWVATPLVCVALVEVEVPLEFPALEEVSSIVDCPPGSFSPQPVVQAKANKTEPYDPHRLEPPCLSSAGPPVEGELGTKSFNVRAMICS